MQKIYEIKRSKNKIPIGFPLQPHLFWLYLENKISIFFPVHNIKPI